MITFFGVNRDSPQDFQYGCSMKPAKSITRIPGDSFGCEKCGFNIIVSFEEWLPAGRRLDASDGGNFTVCFQLETGRKDSAGNFMNVRSLSKINDRVARNLGAIEMVGVLMRIFSFSLVSWLGPNSPFLFVWVFNTTDAILLSWCAMLRKDKAYTVLNVFWIGVGIVGIFRASGFMVSH